MSDVNKIILVGRVGRDPESKTFDGGREVVSFSLATSERWKDKSGERKEVTVWHNVVVRSAGASAIAKTYVHKGSRLYVEGTLSKRKYTGKDGAEKEAVEVVVGPYGGDIRLLDAPEKQSEARVSSPSLDDEIMF